MSAFVSLDRRHRYTLTRDVSSHASDVVPQRGRVLFVMLNPSTADAVKDDPTIRKCRGFAERWGFTSLEVVNLFSFRATKPAALWLEADRNTDESDEHILAAVERAETIVMAFGAKTKAQGRGNVVEDMIRIRLRSLGRRDWLHSIGMPAKNGAPQHPLMLAYVEPLTRWRYQHEEAKSLPADVAEKVEAQL